MRVTNNPHRLFISFSINLYASFRARDSAIRTLSGLISKSEAISEVLFSRMYFARSKYWLR